MKVALTGANGFIGRWLSQRLIQGGCGLIALTRNPPSGREADRLEWIRYSLEDGISRRLPDDCDTVIHGAYSMSPTGSTDIELNVGAARALKSAAGGRKFIFISSMSAHPGALSAYGRGKWAIEAMMLPDSDLIIRPGFVVGPGGIFERLRRSLKGLPFVPLFYSGDQPIQTIWVGDLAEGVARAAERRLTGTLNMASADALTLRDFYSEIMRSEGLRRPLVAIPGGPALAALRLIEGVGLRLPVTSENLLGLKALRRFDTQPSLDLLGIAPIGLSEALRKAREPGPAP